MRATLITSLLIAFLVLLPNLARADTPVSFVKLDSAGQELPEQAGDWAMVLDRSTGLTWEIKTSDGSLHDRDNTYSWSNTEGGFIKSLNAEHFGSFDDWRLPEDKELERLQKLADDDPELFARFFPRTAPSYYWTWSRCQDGTHNSAKLKFGPEPSPHSRQHRVRGVRGEFRE